MAVSVVPIGFSAAHPISLTECKEYLRVTGTEQDTVIAHLLNAATDYAETCTGLTIRATRFQFALDHFPYGYTSVPGITQYVDYSANVPSPYYDGDNIILPRMPLYDPTEDATLISVSYTNTAGNNASLTISTDFLVDESSMPGRLYLPYNDTWPQTRAIQGAVIIQFSAGHRATSDAGPFSTSLPDGIRQAIKILVGHWYENREPVVIGAGVNNVPMSVESLLWANRIVSLT